MGHQRIARACCVSRSIKTLKRRQQKSVRFHGTVKVGLKHATQEELKSTWYDSGDYKLFKSEGRRSLAAVQVSLSGVKNAYDATQHCLRGLENCLSAELYVERQQQKSNVVQSVLNQQLMQRVVGVKDDDNLATVSKLLSKEAQDRALTLAAFDSKCI